MFREGELRDLQVERHNAILVPPFETSKALGEFALALAEDFASAASEQSSSASPGGTRQQIEAVCIDSGIADLSVQYEYRWESDEDWTVASLEPRYSVLHSWTYEVGEQTSRRFEIRLDVDPSTRVDRRHFTLEPKAVDSPALCVASGRYELRRVDGLIRIFSLDQEDRV